MVLKSFASNSANAWLPQAGLKERTATLNAALAFDHTW
jgi:hypothetical protein